MEKVFPADRFSGVAIAGAAGPAVEMVKLFQLQLEHYEKVEGTVLSLEGKANQLGQMVRSNLPAAMQGLGRRAAVRRLRRPPRRGPAVRVRRHRRPLRGAEPRRVRLGQPPRRHGRQARVPRGPTRDEPIDLVVHALYRAAEEDSATGGPDLVRGIFPVVATITADGLRAGDDDAELRTQGRGASSAGRCARVMTMPFYVAPEQVMKDRADYARKGIARGRSAVAVALHRGDPHRRREQQRHAPQGQRDLRPHRLRRGGQVQRVRPAPHRRRPPRRPQGLPVQPRGRGRPQPRQRLRPDPRPDLHARDEADGGGDPRRGGRRRRRQDQVFHIL